jgi:galactokinase
VTFVEPGDPAHLAAGVRAALAGRFGVEADVVGRAPGRVNLIGEHTDYNGGLCLPVALPHATYVAAARREDDGVQVASRQADDVWSGRLDQTGPGQVDGWAAYVVGVLWAMREDGHQVPGVDLVIDSTVPLGAGLSSSAAIECATAVALASLLDLDLSPDVRRALARACMRAESEVAGAPTGGMDQMVSMLAEPAAALLVDFDDHTDRAVQLDLSDHVLLVTDTRVTHELTDGGYGSRRADCERAAEELGVPTLRQASLADLTGIADPVRRRRAHHVVTEIERVADAVQAVKAGDWARLGRLLLASHASLRDDFEVSCAELDASVVAAVGAGAVGARMTGGGFGGSAVALVPADGVEQVTAAIDEAFVTAGFAPPQHLLAPPSAAAGPV